MNGPDSHRDDKTPLGEALEFAERWKGVHTDESYGPQGKIMGTLSRELLALHAQLSEIEFMRKALDTCRRTLPHIEGRSAHGLLQVVEEALKKTDPQGVPSLSAGAAAPGESQPSPAAPAPCVVVPIVKGRALTPQESWADRCGIDRADERAIEPHIYGWPDKYAIFRDGWDAACLTVAQYLKDGETVAEAMERNWLDSQNALGLFAKERIAKEQVMGVLRRLYDAFPDCEGGEQGAACVEARAILATAGNHERNGE